MEGLRADGKYTLEEKNIVENNPEFTKLLKKLSRKEKERKRLGKKLKDIYDFLVIDIKRNNNKNISRVEREKFLSLQNVLGENGEKYKDTVKDRIKLVQTALKKMNYLGKDSKIDGIVGLQTILAIHKFQKTKGIDADAIIGTKTISKIIDDLKNTDLKEDNKDKKDDKEIKENKESAINTVLDVVTKPNESFKKEVKSNLDKRIKKIEVLIKILDKRAGKEIKFTKEEEKIKKQLEANIKDEELKKIDISKLENTLNQLKKQRAESKNNEKHTSYKEEKEVSKNKFAERLTKFKNFMEQHGFKTVGKNLDEIIEKINDKGSEYGKGIEAFDKALTKIENAVSGNLSFMEMVGLLTDKENAEIFSDIKNILSEILKDSIGLVVALVRDLSIMVIGVLEINDYRDGIVVKKAKGFKKQYNTGIDFIDNVKNDISEGVVLKSATCRGAEEAIFDMIQGLSKVKLPDIEDAVEGAKNLGEKMVDIANDLGNLMPEILEYIPKIIAFVKEEFKKLFDTITSLGKEDIAYLAGYIAVLIFFPLKTGTKYLKGGITKIFSKIKGGKKAMDILEKIDDFVEKANKKISLPEKLEKIKKKGEKILTAASRVKQQSEQVTA